MRRTILSALLISALASIASAWHDTGHMVVADIARARLKPNVISQIDELLKVGGDAKTQDMYGAACWADDVRSQRRESGPWHYINYHFRLDGKETDNLPDAENVVVAIARFKKVLGDENATKEDRADALRFILHFVGDIHQPLHTVACDSDDHPNGDKGGNDFQILPPGSLASMNRPPKNLHSLWDMAGGLYQSTPRPLTAEGIASLDQLARHLEKENPADKLSKEIEVSDPEAWAKEGLAIAKESVYNLKPGEAPGSDYMIKCRKICSKRLALAGYRLANLLNDVLGSKSR
jgi:hypothetical protein